MGCFMALPLCKAVRSLSNDIRELQRELTSISAPESRQDAAKTVPQRIAQLQLEFQKIITGLNQVGLTPEVEQRLRPCQTEGHRRLQLLGVGAMRLQAAKKAETIVSVRSQIEDHLTQLQKFVDAMAADLCD